MSVQSVLTGWQLPSKPKICLAVDNTNPRAAELAAALAKDAYVIDTRRPDIVVVIGGDGFMLRTIMANRHRSTVVLGINAGHHGHLLNEPSIIVDGKLPTEFDLCRLPMLQVDTETRTGRVKRHYAFNDVWIERKGGQSAWIKITVNDCVRRQQLVADGIIVSTPAGSTAYSWSAGAMPVPLDSDVMLLTPINAFIPLRMDPALLSQEDVICLENLDSAKRPLRCFVNGQPVGDVSKVTVCRSPTEGVKLAFRKGISLREKILRAQFPPDEQRA